jgi:hypothetical protein
MNYGSHVLVLTEIDRVTPSIRYYFLKWTLVDMRGNAWTRADMRGHAWTYGHFRGQVDIFADIFVDIAWTFARAN